MFIMVTVTVNLKITIIANTTKIIIIDLRYSYFSFNYPFLLITV